MSPKRPTPRIPGVRPPSELLPPSSTRPPKARPLEGAVQISGPGWEITLRAEEVLIGRDPSCRIVVDDSLVSRQHARIRISPDRVIVEDLRSANGLYLNNVRIYEPCQLFDGDRILLGTTELCVFTAEAPVARPHAAVPAAATSAPTPSPAAATERAAALDVLGRLADRMLADARPQHAERVLADHLTKLLDGARSGLPVPQSVCAGAARHALKLARALGDGKWINYMVELHLRAELVMSHETVSELTQVVELTDKVDHALFSYYVEWVRDVVPRMPPGTVQILERLDNVKLPSSR